MPPPMSSQSLRTITSPRPVPLRWGERGIDLAEWLEQTLAMDGSNADAGIRHGDDKPQRAGRARGLSSRGQFDRPGRRCELERISEQVAEDLVDAQGIREEPLRHGGVDVAAKLQPLLPGFELGTTRDAFEMPANLGGPHIQRKSAGSIRERSRTSVTSASSMRPLCSMLSAISCCSAGDLGSFSRGEANPMTP